METNVGFAAKKLEFLFFLLLFAEEMCRLSSMSAIILIEMANIYWKKAIEIYFVILDVN